jgi:hypothetical protein
MRHMITAEDGTHHEYAARSEGHAEGGYPFSPVEGLKCRVLHMTEGNMYSAPRVSTKSQYIVQETG